MPEGRPQAPGYLANLMARLFHDVSAEGLEPLGVAPDQFPVLIALWFGSDVSRSALSASLELDQPRTDALVREMAVAGLITALPDDAGEPLRLTERGAGIRDPALGAARAANAAAEAALSEAELAAFLGYMNRVIDALKAAR